MGAPGRRPDFVLSTDEFDLLWSELGLPPVPYPLQVPSTGRTLGERARLVTEVYRGLAERGLATGRRLDARLEAMLTLLAGPEVALDAVGHIGYPVRALAAAAGRTGVLAVLAGGEVWMTEIAPSTLVGEIVGVFPAGCPGSEPVPPEVTRSAGGQIGAFTGERVSTVVTWFDTPGGRYLLVPGPEGVTFTATGPGDLARRVAGLLDRSPGKIHTARM
ncbi:ESX secretion-associated protein EspG [Amycolatopsis endophytica]|nr:ESX secretion-associated protein EspG [Amycolatopsis endophytica]